MFSKDDKKTLIIYSGLALLFIYPLIQAGIFYRDDLDRSITGNYGWRGLGRPAADILMRFLSASGHFNLDLFPYTMLASGIFIAGAAFALSKHLIKLEVSNARIAAALLIFNPFILQNISYRYDSIAMSIAFFLAVIAYTYTNNNRITETSIKIIAGVLSFTLYQSCANIFIGLLAIDFIIIAINKHASLKFSINLLLRKTALFASFCFIYFLLFSPKNNSRSELIHLNMEGIEKLTVTLTSLKELVFSFFYHPTYLYFLIPVLVVFVFMIFSYRAQKKNIALFIFYTLIASLIFIISLMGPTLLLQDAPVLPRTLVSFSVILVMIAIPLMHFAPGLKYLSLIPAFTAFAFSAQLSSAMKSQHEYEDFIFSMIARDLADHKDIASIGTVGHLNMNERARLLTENKPLIRHFVSPATEFLASFQLINKGFPQTSHGYFDVQENKNQLATMIGQGVKPVSSNEYYALFISDKTAIVFLGKYSD